MTVISLVGGANHHDEHATQVQEATRSPEERRQSEAFDEYVRAKMRVEETGKLEDGIVTGKAFRRFLDTFLSPNQRAALGSTEANPLAGRK